MLLYRCKDSTNMPTSQGQNKPLQLNNFDERDNTWESIVEMLSAIIKVGVFCTCIYILKEIFLLANDMFYIMETQNIDVISLEIIPFLVLLILASFALWLMTHD